MAFSDPCILIKFEIDELFAFLAAMNHGLNACARALGMYVSVPLCQKSHASPYR